MKELIATVIAGREAAPDAMEQAIDAMFRGASSPAQMAALLVGLRMKGETANEIAAAARAMRKHCVRVTPTRRDVLVDTCGTGGDGANTFNISTAAAIVVSAAGAAVAKHGNRAASSKAGSADVLEVLGVQIEISPERVARCIDELGIGFMFARTHHPAMRHVGPVRSEIGVRTLFNFLGPLSNPAGATRQVIGVPEPRLLETLARALQQLDAERVWTVHGHGGLDEIAISGPTRVARLEAGQLTLAELQAEDFGLVTQPNADLRGGDATVNAAIIRRVLAGEQGAPRDAVVVNAAAALHIAGVAGSLREGAERAAAAIDSGAAAQKLQAWSALSHQS